MQFKVLVCDGVSQKGIDVLQDPQIAIDVKPAMKPDELKKIIGDYDAMVVRSQTKLTADVIECAGKLKVVGRAGVGVDNIDVDAATKKGIIVMNTPGGNTISTAEQTMALMLALARNIAPADASMKQGKWDRKLFTGVELFEKTLGIIGLGRIGREVAKRAQSFGMKILAYDPFLSPEQAEKLGVESADLEKIFKESDVITVHTPLSDDTKSIINKASFAKMKKDVKIINCARGGIVDEKDLAEALAAGQIGGAALDVYSVEPLDPENAFKSLKNILLTPHLGASTTEAQEKVGVDVAFQVKQALLGGTVINAVNLPSIDRETLERVAPYLALAEKLGRFAQQITPGGIKSVKVTCSGDMAEFPFAPMSTAVLKGILKQIIDEPINEVNAPVIAKDRGISVTEKKSAELKDFAELMSVKLVTDEGSNTVAGTVLGRAKQPRIVEINDNYVDVIPAGFVLVLKNQDKPGTIGTVGTALGQAGINIGGMTVGRMQSGAEAITVVNVDSEVPAKTLAAVRALPNILDVRLVKF